MFKWHKFGIPLDDLKVAHKKALDVLLENKCYNYIAETSEATGTLLPQVIEWWSNEWVPKLQKSRIKAIVTVLPKNILAKLSTTDWQASVIGNLITKNVASFEEAEKFLDNL